MLAHRLILVVAGAGWGKSTLLRGVGAATRSATVARPPSGWTPFSLARALLDALADRVANETATAVDLTATLPPYTAPDHPSGTDHASALAAAVCDAADRLTPPGQHLVLIADDADTINDSPLNAFLETLVLHLPARVHLVLAARRAPDLRVARLRAAGDVATVATDDLALRADDVDTTLVDIGHDRGADGVDADVREAMRAVIEQTGGWPLATRLAGELVKRTGSLGLDQLIERLLAPDAVLFDYLASDVMATLGDDEIDALRLLSWVPKLTPAVLTAVDRDHLIDPLVRLGRDRVFAEPLPTGADEYRATILGREFVHRSLPRPSAAELSAVALAFTAASDLDAAVQLAADLNDPAIAADVLAEVDRPDRVSTPTLLADAIAVAANGPPLAHVTELDGDVRYRTGRWDEALAAYARAAELRVAAGQSITRLVARRASILYLLGRLDAADDLCATADLASALEDPSRIEPDEAAAAAWVLSWRAVICWTRGDTDGCAAFVAQAEPLAVAADKPAALAAVHTATAMLAALEGDLRANLDHYDRALAHAEAASDVMQIVRIRSNRGSRFTEEGRYHDAVAELDEAIRLAELAGWDAAAGTAHSNRGEALLALGDLDAALVAFRRAEEVWTRVGSGRVMYARTNLGTVQLVRGQRTQAIAMFREALSAAESSGDAQAANQARVGLATALRLDHPDEAAVVIDAAIADGHGIWLPHALSTAGAIARRRDDMAAAADYAARAIDAATARRDRPALAEALLLQATLERPPAAAPAREAARLWEELGNTVGKARADLVVAATVSSRQRDRIVADAERVLYETGALGYLAEWRQLGQAFPPAVTIATLGGFRLQRDGRTVDASEWGSRKARDLVKLLVARRGAPVVRDEAVEVLWPDDSERAARRLSVLLSTARAVFDPDKRHPPEHFINADNDTIWLVRDHVEIDVELFLADAAEGRRLLAAGDDAKAAELLAAAAGRFIGEFCADDPYADWLAGTRQLARNTFVDTSYELARLADRAGEHNEAIRNWLRLLEVDPYDEDAHLGMIGSLLAQRRHGEARRAYNAYCAKLAEIDIEPAAFPSTSRY